MNKYIYIYIHKFIHTYIYIYTLYLNILIFIFIIHPVNQFAKTFAVIHRTQWAEKHPKNIAIHLGYSGSLGRWFVREYNSAIFGMRLTWTNFHGDSFGVNLAADPRDFDPTKTRLKQRQIFWDYLGWHRLTCRICRRRYRPRWRSSMWPWLDMWIQPLPLSRCGDGHHRSRVVDPVVDP